MTGVLAALAPGGHLHSSNHPHPLNFVRGGIEAEGQSPTAGVSAPPATSGESQRSLTPQAAKKVQEDRGVSSLGPWGNMRSPGRATRPERAAAKSPRSSSADRVPQGAGPDPAPRCGQLAASARRPTLPQHQGADPVPRPRGGLSRKSRPYVDVTDAARASHGRSG